MNVIGIDPGLSGAIALVTDGPNGPTLVEVFDAPVYEAKVGKKNRRRIDCPRLLYRMAELVARIEKPNAYVEESSIRPGEGAVGAHSCGKNAGYVEMAALTVSRMVSLIRPQKWKAVVGLPLKADKDQSRYEARRRFPEMADRFTRKMDDGRAEAALIALAGLLIQQGHALAGVEDLPV